MSERQRQDVTVSTRTGVRMLVTAEAQRRWDYFIGYVAKYGPLPDAVEGPRAADPGDPES